MKKLWIPLLLLTVLVTACGQGKPEPEDIAKVAYEWENARFNYDYDREQELIYEEGSFELHKTREKRDAGLKYDDIRYEVYYDEESEWYYVLADFKNPQGDNTVKDDLIIREKADTWRIDVDKSQKLSREDVQANFEQEACIHCE